MFDHGWERLFMKSTDYRTDRIERPQSVTFENGRRVTLVTDDNGSFLVVDYDDQKRNPVLESKIKYPEEA
jgi:hypothetical protein